MLKNYYSLEATNALLEKPNTLAVISHASGTISTHINSVSSGLVRLQEQDLQEVWETNCNSKISAGSTGSCHWRQSSEFLFVSISVPLKNLDDIEEVSDAAYSELLEFIKSSEHKHPIRFWNYMPAINQGAGDLESYKKFCTGRLNGFNKSDYQDADFPAASAVGHYDDGLLVYAIASKVPGVHHHNSMQVNAYEYPRQYGKSSPSFARATSIKDEQGDTLYFISGTASILGHETVHKDCLIGQIETTEKNIIHLLELVDKTKSDVQTMKVYIRHPEDFLRSQELLDKIFPECSKVYLHADICRSDLLIEIECFCT